MIKGKECCRRGVAQRDAGEGSFTELGEGVPSEMSERTCIRHLPVYDERSEEIVRTGPAILSLPKILLPSLRR